MLYVENEQKLHKFNYLFNKDIKKSNKNITEDL